MNICSKNNAHAHAREHILALFNNFVKKNKKIYTYV